MLDEDIKTVLAPCGLNCQKCVAFKQGPIAESSAKLSELLGNFQSYAERYSRFYPEYKNYTAFKELLDYLSKPTCDGCREGHCLFATCGVATCSKIETEKVDYCFQCEDFPCDRPQFHEDLDRRWKERNRRMSEIGIRSYYEESKDSPRYV